MTSIFSKCAERLIGCTLVKFLEQKGFGDMQWAYTKRRSSKDLLLYLVCAWMSSICGGYKIGAYFSDISGAFDKIYTPYILAILRQLGLGDRICDFFASYLAPRTARVVINGSSSEPFEISDSV